MPRTVTWAALPDAAVAAVADRLQPADLCALAASLLFGAAAARQLRDAYRARMLRDILEEIEGVRRDLAAAAGRMSAADLRALAASPLLAAAAAQQLSGAYGARDVLEELRAMRRDIAARLA